MTKLIYVFLAVGVVAGLLSAFYFNNEEVTEVTEVEVPADVRAYIDSKSDLIRLEEPAAGSVVEKSPIALKGVARGYWFFEASFPISLVNWDGLIIAEGYATAESDWMTEEFVPFTATLEFTNPYNPGDPDFMKRGALILQKDNPSGLPEHDDALEIPVWFAQ
jgi:hypothetical protein